MRSSKMVRDSQAYIYTALYRQRHGEGRKKGEIHPHRVFFLPQLLTQYLQMRSCSWRSEVSNRRVTRGVDRWRGEVQEQRGHSQARKQRECGEASF